MAPILYYHDMSPSVRGVLLTANAMGLKLKLKVVNLLLQENLTEDFLKMNPQHTIPTLDDDGFYLWDSHAISGYLVNKYGEDDTLYPKNPTQRAVVDQRLHFDSNILSLLAGSIIRAVLLDNEIPLSEERLSRVSEAYGFLESFLQDREYMATDNPTIADFSLLSSTSTINCAVPIDAEKFPKLSAWLGRCEKLPYYEEGNGVGLGKLATYMKMKLDA